MPYRIAVRFAITGDLRFLSHQDTMRLFERAAVRAELPLHWGQGFNPRPRFSLPLPRPVGVASLDDLVVFELDDVAAAAVQPEFLIGQLALQMPENRNVRLIDAFAVRSVPQALSVDYRLDLPPRTLSGDRVRQLLEQSEHVVQRVFDERGRSQPVDIRPYLEQMRWDETTGRLGFTIKVTPTGSARPAEVLDALGLSPADWGHHLLRETVQWQIEPPLAATAPRKEL